MPIYKLLAGWWFWAPSVSYAYRYDVMHYLNIHVSILLQAVLVSREWHIVRHGFSNDQTIRRRA